MDANLIVGNNFNGISSPGDGPITNNVIANNGWFGISKGGNNISSTIVNNTIVSNGKDGISIWDDRVSTISNNIFSGNGEFGVDVVTANNPSAKRPVVTANLFFNNTDGNFSDINSPVGNDATLNTQSEINSVPGNSDNIVGDPQLVDPVGGDYHLKVGSPAIDAGTNTNAPAADFEGDSRPVDGDGDFLAAIDIGADELVPPPPCNGKTATLVGTPGNDVLIGTTGEDVILGLGGDDVIKGGGRNDTICAGAGADIVDGGVGDDWIAGESGADSINGGEGEDVVYGGGGNDQMLGGDGDDLLFGNVGNDQISGGAGSDIVAGHAGADQLFGGDNDDMLFGGPGNDGIDCGDGDDIANGGSGTDTADANCELRTKVTP